VRKFWQPPLPGEGTRAAVWYVTKLSVVICVGGTVLLVAGAAILAALLFHPFSGLGNIDPPRKHLKEIPIAASACPYVRVLHEIANDVQRNEPVPALLGDNSQTLLAWPTPSGARKDRFNGALVALDLGITVSNTHFPPAVQRYLSTTQHADRQGRAQIAHVYYGLLPEQPASGLLGTGEESFGYASDLVGTQCGVRLQADNSTQPDPPFVLLPSAVPKPALQTTTTMKPGRG
jgi:hypothetical protein